MTKRLLLLAAVLAPLSASSARADDGKATYEKMCASCHGSDGRGVAKRAQILKIDPKLLDLGREESAKATRDELKKILLDGKAKMPAYAKKLKAEEVDPVLDYSMKLAQAARAKK